LVYCGFFLFTGNPSTPKRMMGLVTK